MTVLGYPAVNDSRQLANARQQQRTAKNRPTFATMEQNPRDGHVRRISLVAVDPLNCRLALLATQTERPKIEPLPGFDTRVTRDAPLDESHASGAKCAVSVENQERTHVVHEVIVPVLVD